MLFFYFKNKLYLSVSFTPHRHRNAETTVVHTQLRPEVRYNRQNLEILRHREMHKVSLRAESCSHLPIVLSDRTVLDHSLSLVLIISVPKIVQDVLHLRLLLYYFIKKMS